MLYNLPVIYPFKPFQDRICVLLIGCGGTGGYVAPHLVRLRAVGNIQSLCFVDPDIVEQHNLNRQNFVAADLGRPKAEVLAQRYSAAFGVPVEYHVSRINEDLLNSWYRSSLRRIIISCVDNHHTRSFLSQWLANMAVVWLDAGNELYSGHVSLGYRCYDYYGRLVLPSDPIHPSEFNVPLVTDIFPEILEADEERPQVSCAERAQTDPQTIAANLTAANIILNYVYALASGRPIYSHLVLFDTLNNATETRLNTIDNLTAHLRACVPSQPMDPVVQPPPVLTSG